MRPRAPPPDRKKHLQTGESAPAGLLLPLPLRLVKTASVPVFTLATSDLQLKKDEEAHVV